MQQSIAYFLGKPGRVSTRDGFEICSSTDRKAILFLPYSEAVVAPGYNTERKKSYRYMIRTNGSMPGQAQSNPLQDCQNSRNQSLTIPPVEYSSHLYARTCDVFVQSIKRASPSLGHAASSIDECCNFLRRGASVNFPDYGYSSAVPTLFFKYNAR